MAHRIGFLLPRSTDYPAMGYDIVDALRLCLQQSGIDDVHFFSENIGFGDDEALNHAKAEKLFLQDNVDMIFVYSSSTNAEHIYSLATAINKPLIFLDTGMQLPLSPSSACCYHITLQGAHACRIAGFMAGEGNRRVLMATSFYDGGYRGPYCYDRGLSEAGGSVCGNYVSGFKTAEFTIEPYIGLLHQSGAASVAACFSSYLAELFFKGLNEKNKDAVTVPFYCSPFMAEEQLLSKCDFPGGEFFTVVPWALSLQNREQEIFTTAIKAEKKKEANIFHLLGWEAGKVAMQYSSHGMAALDNFSYASPRGTVTIHPDTHYSYSSLYKGKIEADDKGKCRLIITGDIPVDANGHLKVMTDTIGLISSGWKNNYLCI
jgi:branched-chain amino acid transport system substrate-binding protein